MKKLYRQKMRQERLDTSSKDIITDIEIDAFNKAVRENYKKAWNFLNNNNDKSKTEKDKKSFHYDLGEDTDTELPLEDTIVNDHKGKKPEVLVSSKQKQVLLSRKQKKRVSYDDVKYIGWRISFKFSIKQVTMQDVISTLLDEDIEHDGYVSFEQIKRKLFQMPFNITDPDELDILTRYLVEDGLEPGQDIEDARQRVVIVKSIFKKLLGQFGNRNAEDFKFLNVKILQKLEKKYMTITSDVEKKKDEFMTMQEMDKYFFKFNLDLLPHEFEHIYWRLFLQSRDIDRLPFGKLIVTMQSPEYVNEEGYLIQIEERNFDQLLSRVARLNGFALEVRQQREQYQQKMLEKHQLFEDSADDLVFYQTPLNSVSCLKVIEKILEQEGIILVISEIKNQFCNNDVQTSQNTYQDNNQIGIVNFSAYQKDKKEKKSGANSRFSSAKKQQVYQGKSRATILQQQSETSSQSGTSQSKLVSREQNMLIPPEERAALQSMRYSSQMQSSSQGEGDVVQKNVQDSNSGRLMTQDYKSQPLLQINEVQESPLFKVGNYSKKDLDSDVDDNEEMKDHIEEYSNFNHKSQTKKLGISKSEKTGLDSSTLQDIDLQNNTDKTGFKISLPDQSPKQQLQLNPKLQDRFSRIEEESLLENQNSRGSPRSNMIQISKRSTIDNLGLVSMSSKRENIDNESSEVISTQRKQREAEQYCAQHNVLSETSAKLCYNTNLFIPLKKRKRKDFFVRMAIKSFQGHLPYSVDPKTGAQKKYSKKGTLMEVAYYFKNSLEYYQKGFRVIDDTEANPDDSVISQLEDYLKKLICKEAKQTLGFKNVEKNQVFINFIEDFSLKKDLVLEYQANFIESLDDLNSLNLIVRKELQTALNSTALKLAKENKRTTLMALYKEEQVAQQIIIDQKKAIQAQKSLMVIESSKKSSQRGHSRHSKSKNHTQSSSYQQSSSKNPTSSSQNYSQSGSTTNNITLPSIIEHSVSHQTQQSSITQSLLNSKKIKDSHQLRMEEISNEVEAVTITQIKVTSTVLSFVPVFSLSLDSIQKAQMNLEKKKEKLMPCNAEWAYYSVKGWINYPVAFDRKRYGSWLTCYHPLGGFNFDNYKNLKMCDDYGPNHKKVELSSFSMAQGLFVTPRLSIIMGDNQFDLYHTRPYCFKEIKNQKTINCYYMLVFEVLVNPSCIRVPSAFSYGNKKEKLIYGEYYLVNDPKEMVLKSVLLKKILENEYLSFGQKKEKQKGMNKLDRYFPDGSSIQQREHSGIGIHSEIANMAELKDILKTKKSNNDTDI